MTPEPVADAKKELALDSDWTTAVLVAFLFIICLASTLAFWTRILTGAPVKTHITWETVLLFAALVWLAIQINVRAIRAGCILLAIVSGSRILLALAHSPFDVQILNAQIMRVVDAIVFAGLCVETVYWFKRRIKRL